MSIKEKELVMDEKEKDKLDKLKKQRSSHRGQVTKLISKIKTRLDEPEVEMNELGLLVQLQTKDEQMKSIDSKIENLLEWSHCPGKENTADILSRSISASDLAQNSLWWHGPPWLSQPSEFWPSKVENEKPIGDLEIRNEVEIISQCKWAVYDSELVLDLNKYSDLKSVKNYSFG
ncbi:hypothetical protein HNY73_009689 [Argiope bruennichi]|uniref:Uncharacterized protein n=1 Tax=Argiope bruennichi TaxID=94029 RepID=A0A8T0FAE7_ARGBR|nr:hypothetical protein HNY73_009689 [Argiope bruennichi]